MTETLNLFGMRRLPVIRQTAAAECGLACLAMVAWYHGMKSDLDELRRRFSISMRGADLVGILDIARRIDLGGRGVRHATGVTRLWDRRRGPETSGRGGRRQRLSQVPDPIHTAIVVHTLIELNSDH